VFSFVSKRGLLYPLLLLPTPYNNIFTIAWNSKLTEPCCNLLVYMYPLFHNSHLKQKQEQNITLTSCTSAALFNPNACYTQASSQQEIKAVFNSQP